MKTALNPPQQDEKEAALDAWRKILKIEEKDSNPFEEDHSVIISGIVKRLRKLGYAIDDRELLQYQKTERQSKFLITSLKLINAVKKAKFLIPIQAAGEYIPLFAIPDLLLYCNIGDHISKDQPFYSLEQSCYQTDEEVVAHYISEIKKIHPHGPYNLVGFCRWGNIAVEMAHTLIAQGEEVPLLVLIEYYSPEAVFPWFSMKFIHQKTKFIYKTLRKSQPHKSKRKFIMTESFYVLHFFYKKAASLFARKEKAVGIKTYSGKVVLIRASEMYGVKDDPYMGWSKYFRGELESFKIEGEHTDIMIGPPAVHIAEKLNSVLQQTNKQYGSPLTSISW